MKNSPVYALLHNTADSRRAYMPAHRRFANTSEITVSQFWLGSLLNSFSYPNTSDSGLIISFSMSGAYIAASIIVGALLSKNKQY